jgi:hypothetical protein
VFVAVCPANNTKWVMVVFEILFFITQLKKAGAGS